MSKPKLFAIVVGEKSGDVLGAGLVRELKALYPDARFVGIGGPAMLAEGFETLAAMDRLAVMGFVEPLGRLPELLRIKRQVQDYFTENRPAVFIGIDAPGFNLRLETYFRQIGIKTAHYVSPSVWAYREKRIFKIKKAVDLMLTLFPFETAIYHEHNIDVACVGHPLADTIGFADQQLEHRQLFGLQETDKVVTLMPGSRGGEIKRLAPIFLGAALESLQQYPELKFLIPCAGPEAKLQLKDMLRASNVFTGEQFQLVDDSHQAISAADLVVLASGTATLEALLMRRPMIVGYKVAPLTYAIASRLVKIPYVALPNLLAGKGLVPELLQHDITVPALKAELLRFFDEGADHQALLDEFDKIHRSIRLDASRSSAVAIQKLVEQE